MRDDLRQFVGSARSLRLFSANEVPALAAAAGDPQLEGQRLSVLGDLVRGERPIIIASLKAICRRGLSPQTLLSTQIEIELFQKIDRDELVQRLVQLGYARAPLCEDPGTFSVRGGIVDVFGFGSHGSIRIELDDDTVHELHGFDPTTQKRLDSMERACFIAVRELLFTESALNSAKRVIRHACDEVHQPTRQTAALLERIETQHSRIDASPFAPAFRSSHATLFDYLPNETSVFVDAPVHVLSELNRELEHAIADHDVRQNSKQPVLDFSSYYANADELATALQAHRLVLNHRLAIFGRHDSAESLEQLLSPGTNAIRINAVEHLDFKAKLTPDARLERVVEQSESWQNDGIRTVFVASTTARAERLVRILRDRGLSVPLATNEAKPSAESTVVVGPLKDGFLWQAEGVSYLGDREIFGHHSTDRQKPKTRTRDDRFIEDLRQLNVGDYVVHVEHGVAQYVGLERKSIALSAYERMQGAKERQVEVLVLRYSGGDKLFLPITRLGTIQKFSGREGASPRLDKLGGSTFSAKKSKVRRAVQLMAEELLKLYAERKAIERPSLEPAGADFAEFEARFPYEETRDQGRAIDEVLRDLEQSYPMDRLVCGDVGFGKTEVAMRAAYRVAMSGRQVAVLCPTTVLAQQHFVSFSERFDGTPINIRMLSRFVGKSEQTETVADLKSGKVDLVIGTHRLLSKDVHFSDLGRLIVDEEQRFGVAHKERIKKLRTKVDVLTLSATPIPRTLHLAVGGVRDLSLIKTAPTDRRAVRTIVCRWDPALIKDAIERELARSGQVFYVFNRIEGLYERARKLQELVPNARFAVAHGQMNEKALEQTMADFVGGQYDVLCSTAIVESGLDIPRANTMIIDAADRFGLSQLYQLRGRVGRSQQRAYCFLVTPPIDQLSDEARARLEALERFTELGAGFQVAALDMEIRGAGDLLGAEQSGTASLVGFDLFVSMLNEAIAELRGDVYVQEFDPELSFDTEHHLPETYVEDIGLRLSYYRRFATASNEEALNDLSDELETRFGPPPPPAMNFIRIMSLQPTLRALRIAGCEANLARVVFHLRKDTTLDPQRVLETIQSAPNRYALTPDMKLSVQFDSTDQGDTIDRVERALRHLQNLQVKP
ncbi:MAG: transcription-repair coupling factor [Polyangiales bacterium]